MATALMAMPVGRRKDPSQRGLYLDVVATAGGKLTRTWLHRFSFKQTRDTYHTIGHFPETSLEKARRLVQAQRELLSQGIDPRRAAPRRRAVNSPLPLSSAAVGDQHSIEFLASEFMERYIKPNHKDPSQTARMLQKDVLCADAWKGRDARTIKPREVIDLLDGIVARGSPAMANDVASMLKQMFLFGIHRTIVEDTPVKLLMAPGGEEKPRDRVLTDKELAIFLKDPDACTKLPKLAIVITVLLTTAARRQELVLARWSDVDLRAGTWLVPASNSKTGRAFTIPLSSMAVEAFERLKKRADGSVWVLPGEDPKEHIDAKLLTRGLARNLERMEKLGIKAFTLHDLRRTARTGLGNLGIAPHIGERCLNHSVGGMQDVYDKADYLTERRAALEKWAAHLESLRAT